MKRKNSTRNALVTSIISLLLCVSMLVGTTFAWFTDTVESGVNVINAGNLDVELYHDNGAEKVDGQTDLFNLDEVEDQHDLWEPGAVAYENFTVKNEGNLALKYQLALNFTNATTNSKGRTLADVLKVAVVEGGFSGDREDAKALDFNKSLSTFTLSGTLEEHNDSDTYGIVIYWEPSDKDNDYNMKNVEKNEDGSAVNALKIDLGVSLFATQLEHEDDSFDNTYDEDAALEIPEVKVETPTADALLKALKNGETAVLPSDLTLDGDGVIPADKTSAIDLNGYTLTLGKNGIEVNGNLIVTNGTVNVQAGEDDLTFGIVVNNGAVLDIESNATINVTEAGVAGIFMNGGDLNVDGTINVNGNNSVGVDMMYADADVNVNGTINATNGYAIRQYDGTSDVELAEDAVSGEIMLGQTGTMNLTYVGDAEPTVNTDGTAVTLNVMKGISTAAELLSYSGKALTGNNGTAETVTLALMNDIDMGGAEFSAIIAQRGDSLTFKGNGHTISNVNIVSGANDNTTGQASMFYAYPNSTLNVSELILENITVKADENSTGYAAAVVGYCEGTANLTNVDVVNANVTGSKSSGMLVGHLTPAGSLTATDCDVTGTITLSDFEADGHYAGEYLGTMAGNVSLTNCTANVTLGGNLKSSNIGTIYGRKVSGTLTIGNVETVIVANQAGLQAALDAAAGDTTILLAADITGDVIVSQKEGVNIVIDGADYKYDGTIYVYGNSRNNGEETLTIKNVNFVTTGEVTRDFIHSYGDNTKTEQRYAHNVTIEDCTFTNENGGTVVAARFRQAYNITIKDCTIEGTFSPLWTTGVQGLTIQNVTANCANEGMTIGASNNVLIEDCTITVPGENSFGIRTDATDGYKLTVNNCTLNVATPIVIRGSSDTYTVTVDGAKLVASAADLVDAIANGKAVELTQDVSLDKIDLTDAITNDVVINANGHKITTTEAYGIEVTAGKNVTISNADVVMTKEGDYITYAAGFKIANGDYAGAKITLSNCTITMANEDWAYAVNMPAGVKNLNLVIDNCTLEGAIAVQCWGDNNNITITNSELICNYTTSALYTSYCVVLQSDGSYVSENNTLVIDNCEFKYSGVDNFNSQIYSVDDLGTGNTVTVTNCTYGEKVVAE